MEMSGGFGIESKNYTNMFQMPTHKPQITTTLKWSG